jgi:nucleoside-diphosphate-sugar epimerase
LARLVLETANSKAETINHTRTDAGVSRMCADLTLAREKLGYQPRISLAEGLRMTLERDARFSKDIPTRPLP